jgi:hypothetical protein
MLAIVRVLPWVRAFAMRAILLDRTAERPIEVMHFVELALPGGILDRLREVVGLQRLACAAEINRPRMALPPVFGTTFITSPAVSDSPRPPDVVKVTSWAFPISAV